MTQDQGALYISCPSAYVQLPQSEEDVPMSRTMTSAMAVEPDGPFGGSRERFALGRPRWGVRPNGEAPSVSGMRPFGLRFAATPQPSDVALPPWRYCPDRQIAVSPDGGAWYELVDMTMRTTGYSTDGGGSTGNEEYTPDYVDDGGDQV